MPFDPTKRSRTAWGPAEDGKPVTPNDDADLPDEGCVGLWVGTAGTVVVTTRRGTLLPLVCGDSSLVPLQITRVHEAGTDADDIVALY
jgi:hypothetical protein